MSYEKSFYYRMQVKHPSMAPSPSPWDEDFNRVLASVQRIRILQMGLLESVIVDRIVETLKEDGIACETEVRIGTGSRIDLVVPVSGTSKFIGIEVKKGRPRASSVERQIERYAATDRLSSIIFVAERAFALPPVVCGIRVASVSLHSAFGLSL